MTRRDDADYDNDNGTDDVAYCKHSFIVFFCLPSGGIEIDYQQVKKRKKKNDKKR